MSIELPKTEAEFLKRLELAERVASTYATAFERERIIELLEETQQNSPFIKAIKECQLTLADGNDVVEDWVIITEYVKHIDELIALINKRSNNG